MEVGRTRERWHALDHLKAAAIVAVVFTHAGRVSLESWNSPVDFVLTSLWTRFHVPSFLFASGFLYARSTPIPLDDVGRRWGRILLPYLVLSVPVLALGVLGERFAPALGSWPPAVQGPGDVLWRLATASALGIYYYVFLMALFVPLLWPLSRMGAGAVAALVAACLAILVATSVGWLPRPAFAVARHLPGDGFFWALRLPVEGFKLGYFVLGWLVALRLPRLTAWHARHRVLDALLCAAGLAFGWAAFADLLPMKSSPIPRVVYTLAVIALFAITLPARPAPPAVRFLGETSLAIYLSHRAFQILAEPWTQGFPPLPRIGAQVAVGLGGALLLIWAARRLLGEPRARRWLGA